MSTFKNTITQSIGLTPTTVYTSVGNAIMIGLDIANSNSGASACTVDVTITKGGTTIYYLKAAPLPAGSTLQVIGGQKVVLMNGDILKVTASAATSADVTCSILEGV